MIKFFRRIRQNLLLEGNTGKYLKYAIGEIVLVVIGILIALSLNNWNELRKDGIKEEKLLNELADNLELNLSFLDSIISDFKEDEESSKFIIEVLENKHIYNDTLDYHFARALNSKPLHPLSILAYESMKNAGFDIIRNDQLRKDIIYLFEMTYSTAKLRQSESPVIWEFILKRFMQNSEDWSYKPYDFDELVEDKEFRSMINYLKSNRWWIKIAYEKSNSESKRVLQLIKDELNK